MGSGRLVREALAAVVGERAAAADLVALTGGASRETWRCRVGDEGFVVQLRPPASERNGRVEARVVQAAAAAGVDVPEMVACVELDDGSTGLVAREVPGETIPRRILRDPEFAGARSTLVGDLGRAAARLHSVDPASVAGLELEDPVAHYRERLDEVGEPHPAFELAFGWLEQHRPASDVDRLAIVHGDLRLGNVIVSHDRMVAVVDWELAHVGNPIEDLGWMCVRAWRFGRPDPVAGLGTRDELVDAYVHESRRFHVELDRDVVLESLRWWEIVGTLRWGIMCVMQAAAHLTGVRRSHELAAIGRRVCENEYDLFVALEGRW